MNKLDEDFNYLLSSHSTSETYEDSSSGESFEEGCSISTNGSRREFSLKGSSLVEDYLRRRNRRLEALKAGRLERREQMQTGSISKKVGSSALLCFEDHPYYLAKQEKRLRALRTNCQSQDSTTVPRAKIHNGQSSQSGTPSSAEPPLVEEALRAELVAAYQLIHRQRVRIQQLEKQQQGEFVLPVETEKSMDRESLIRDLQSQVIKLYHDRAQQESYFRNRISHDAVRHQDLVNFFKTKAEYWQTRGQNASESHECEMNKARRRIADLETLLADNKAPGSALGHEAASEDDSENKVPTVDTGDQLNLQTVDLLVPFSRTPRKNIEAFTYERQKSATVSSPERLSPRPKISRRHWAKAQQAETPDGDTHSFSSACMIPSCTFHTSPGYHLTTSSGHNIEKYDAKDTLFPDAKEDSAEASGSQADFLKHAMMKKTRKFSLFNNAASLWEKAGSFRGGSLE